MKLSGTNRKVTNIFLALLIISSSFSNNFLSVYTQVGEITAFRAFLLIFVIHTLLISPKVRVFSRSNYSYNIVIFLFLVSLVTVLFVKDWSAWIKYEFFIIESVLLLIVYNRNIYEAELYIFCLRLFQFTCIIQALIGTYEFFTGDYKFLNDSQAFEFSKFGINHPAAMLGNVNDFAVFLFIGMCCSIGLYSLENKKIIKIFDIASIVWFLFLIFESSSRACLLSAIIAIASLYLFFTEFKNKTDFLKGLGITVVMVSVFVLLYSKITTRLNDYVYSNSIRLNLLKNAFEYLKMSYGLGIGSGQEVYYLINKNIYFTRGIYVMHNLWITILCSYGVIYFGYFVVSYFDITIKLFKNKHNDDFNIKGISKGLFLFMLGFTIACISPASVFVQEWFWAFFIFVVCFADNTILNLSD